MSQSNPFSFPALGNRLGELIQTKCNPNSCKVSSNDTAVILRGGLGGMIPHTVIVLVYRFAMAHNLLIYFDTDDGRIVLH